MTVTVLNTKIKEVENKIPDMSGLVTTRVVNTKIGDVENKTPNLSLVKKIDYDAKILHIDKKYFITFDYNKSIKKNIWWKYLKKLTNIWYF